MKNLNKISKIFGLVAVGGLSLASSAFATAATPKDKVGLNRVFGGGNLFTDGNVDAQSIITLIFQILLGAAILWVVYNIVVAGIKIAGAKEDADKRKEGLKSIINAAIGLVVALSAFAIVTVVTKQLGGNTNEAIGIPCTGKDGTITRVGKIKEDGGCYYTNSAGTDIKLTQTP